MPRASVIFHRLAGQEYRDIHVWYAGRRPGLEDDFKAELDRAAARIAANPLCGSVFRRRFRWVGLRRFPYLLYYYVIDQTQVLVFAVAHARRRPGYWIGRLYRP